MAAMMRRTSRLVLFMNGPGIRSMELEKTRNPKTIADPHPMGFHCARASRHEAMPRKAIIKPQPSVEWGNDQRVSSSPNLVCQMPSKKPARPVTANPPPARAIGPGTAKGSSGRERVTEPAAKVRREGDVRERDRRAEMHRVDELVRRREEVLERMRPVPGAIPTEPDAERQDVEDDREPEESVRGVEADALLCWLGGDCGGRHAQWIRQRTWRRSVESLSATAIPHNRVHGPR